jgi:hypothetical protein
MTTDNRTSDAPTHLRPAGYTAGQRITMISPERCVGMSGIISDVSGDGKTLHVRFDDNDYNSLVGSHQVKAV